MLPTWRVTLVRMSELTPYICVSDARAAIEWYAEALGAEVTYEPIVMDDGRVGHCELTVDGARWMMSDEFESAGVAPPAPDRGASVTLHLTVDDCDAAAARVTATGTEMTRGPEDSPPAGRVAVFTDPFGHRWFLNQPGD
jgi:PhnB protein